MNVGALFFENTIQAFDDCPCVELSLHSIIDTSVSIHWYWINMFAVFITAIMVCAMILAALTQEVASEEKRVKSMSRKINKKLIDK